VNVLQTPAKDVLTKLLILCLMARSLNIPKFHTKDFTVLVGSMLPMGVLLNYFLYDKVYFSSTSQFITTTVVTFIYLGAAFLTYGFVAISLRNRFPHDNQLFKRLAICLSIFFLMSAVYISLLLLAYDYVHFYGYEYLDSDFTKGYLTLITINIFLTFLNEGIYRFEKFKITITETEQLKKEYMHSQLLGLKSQMNPHFLFNSLNSLSSLIHEDGEIAEEFLDHMSKVYRYLLRNNEEKLVTIETEINFINSYYFLLKARHEDGLQLHVDIPPESKERWIPPLTLQMIVENAMNQNAISRSKPLMIWIRDNDHGLEIINSVAPKINSANSNAEIEENINNKYRLLCGCEIEIEETDKQRSIVLPVIANKDLYSV
jgi:two-component system, LytTR family, sensor kinase